MLSRTISLMTQGLRKDLEPGTDSEGHRDDLRLYGQRGGSEKEVG